MATKGLDAYQNLFAFQSWVDLQVSPSRLWQPFCICLTWDADFQRSRWKLRFEPHLFLSLWEDLCSSHFTEAWFRHLWPSKFLLLQWILLKKFCIRITNWLYPTVAQCTECSWKLTKILIYTDYTSFLNWFPWKVRLLGWVILHTGLNGVKIVQNWPKIKVTEFEKVCYKIYLHTLGYLLSN